MPTHPLPHIATRLLAAGLLAAIVLCLPALARDRINGSGTVRTEARSVGSFRAVEGDGSIDIVLRQGAKEGVELSADDNLLPLIETEVVERHGVKTLQIRTTRGSSYHTRHPVVATVDLIALESLTMSGSGNLSAERLKAGALRLNIEGSSDARIGQLSADDFSVQIAGSGGAHAGGRASQLTLSIAGSGDVDTRDLAADDVKVSIAGSGDAKVNARRTIAVSIVGSGSVTYTGDATLKRNIIGSGNVTRH